MNPSLLNPLGALPYESGVTTRTISPENPTGAKGGGCKWQPDPADPNLPHSGHALDLGRGWKVRPFIQIKSGNTATLAEIDGPASIRHIWITSNLAHYRALVLRCYWDEEQAPSVEVPLGDFFAAGHDTVSHNVFSLPVTVAPHRGCNCFWQMPFRKHARITLENESAQDVDVVAYSVTYKMHPVPDDAAYFHAQWRRSQTRREYPEHTIVDGIRGQGAYVGTYLAWTSLSDGWWGEGEVKFYLDGDEEFPTISATGTEDYFGGAWCFKGEAEQEQPFHSPFLGLAHDCDASTGLRRFSLYRWHILDSIGFTDSLKATVQALGWWPNRRYQPLTDDIASVAFWYQTEPHAPFPDFPPLQDRWSR